MRWPSKSQRSISNTAKHLTSFSFIEAYQLAEENALIAQSLFKKGCEKVDALLKAQEGLAKGQLIQCKYAILQMKRELAIATDRAEF